MFLLIDEATVRQYKADLTDEIEPQINELLDRAEKGVKALFRKESQMQTKVGPLDIHVTKYFVERYVLPRSKPHKPHDQDLHEGWRELRHPISWRHDAYRCLPNSGSV